MRRIDENGYERGKLEHSDLIHRQVAYREIYLKNRKNYPLPFSEYQIHHKDGNKRNNDVSNLQIVTEEEHRKIHGLDSASVRQKQFIKNLPAITFVGVFAVAMIALFIYMMVSPFSPKNVGSISDKSVSQQVATPQPVFTFQKQAMSEEEIKSEIASKIKEYEASHSGVSRCNVYDMAKAWNVPAPTKGSGRACSYTMNIDGVQDVKVVFQADCLGCRNSNGYTVSVTQ